MTYYYTAMFRPTTGEIQFAEHFEDVKERDKRATQLEAEARRQSPPDVDGKPTDDAWMCYKGDKPVEWTMAFVAYLEAHPMGPEVTQAEWDKIMSDAEKVADKVKSCSVLTAPEIDDSELIDPVTGDVLRAGRPIPPIQLALSAVEKATQAVNDAKTGADALQKRADNLAEEAYGTGAQSEPEERKQVLRRKAVDAQAEADNEKARLYHAEQDLAEKLKIVEDLKNA